MSPWFRVSGSPPTAFASDLLAWFDVHGRRHLPWQRGRDPYRIWISEIMLQQTQVTTVIPYFERFVKRFPTVRALADAGPDEVLHQWTGLGYYARARNLHRAARVICDIHGGVFPRELAQVHALPGIGRSTAGAILAFAHGQRHPILDGNVKRVLARRYAIDTWPGERQTEKRLWRLAARNTPHRRVADYTQAIMDLGALICTRRPLCGRCPVARACLARRTGSPERYPAPKPRRELPTRRSSMLLIRNDAGEVLLQRRPPAGVWGGLWCFPECADPVDAASWAEQHLGLIVGPVRTLGRIQHGFTHYRLDIEPLATALVREQPGVMESPERLWYNPSTPPEIGLAAPVKRLLSAVSTTGSPDD